MLRQVSVAVFLTMPIQKTLFSITSKASFSTLQICAAASWLLVQETIAPRFIHAIKDAFTKSTDAMGDGRIQ